MSKENDVDSRSCASAISNEISMESDSSNANGRASPLRTPQKQPNCQICAVQIQHSRYISVIDSEVRGKREALQQYEGVTFYSPDEETHYLKLREEEKRINEQFSLAFGKLDSLKFV
ncbi:hypothetical protein AVEN_29734-1 [Araneus ventricosus]|uniref:Uncharacterized protein n=1 Tax=Araneus ventricosus TaxID=182803 RepID=A0A4Y2PBA1_ARAVE|nr:hypothetical protein AVEN_29734-1 [Araneus ventricosus]